LAGFAGIIATFQFAGDKEIRRGDAVGLTMILQFPLLTSLICSFANLLYSFDLKETTLWAICRAISAVLQAWASLGVQKSMRGVDKTQSFGRLTMILQTPSLVLILINVMNASDIFFHREAGPIIASIVYTLSVAGFMFSRLLLIPIWRSVRKQQAAKHAEAAIG
jgi:hypothetical protein